MTTLTRFIATILILSAASFPCVAQTPSESMAEAIKICRDISAAFAIGGTDQLRAANRKLKDAEIVDFADLRLINGREMPLDGHIVFDEEFIDSILVNRIVIKFSERFANSRALRGGSNRPQRIKMTTRALAGGEKAEWETINRRNAEYAIVAEPGGRLTLTIRDVQGRVLYVDTVDNRRGAAVRTAVLQLPDHATRLRIEVKNNGFTPTSFAILGN